MILELQLWKAKPGHKEALIALGKAECQRIGITNRIYTSLTHPGNVVIFEYQFNDLGEQTNFWARWRAEPQAQEYLQRLGELVEREHRNELYQVL